MLQCYSLLIFLSTIIVEKAPDCMLQAFPEARRSPVHGRSFYVTSLLECLTKRAPTRIIVPNVHMNG